MKAQLSDELLTAMLPYIDRRILDDVKMKITMVLSKYQIQEESTELIIYQGDINERMINRFLMAKAAEGRTPRTLRYYKQTLFLAFGKINKPFNELTSDDVRLYLATRTQIDGVSKVTANNERRGMSAFYTWLQNEEILLKNPMRKIGAIKEPKKKQRAFTQMEIERIRYACKNSMQTAIVEVLLSTWARVSEVAQIKLSEIDGDKVLIHGKGEKDRTVYLNAKAMMAIERYLKDRNDSNPYLFPRSKYYGDVGSITAGKSRNEQYYWYRNKDFVADDDHRSSSTIEQDVRKIGRKAGVEKVHPHRFRRTRATNALRAGMPLINVSKLLGHENIGTTQIYLDISDKELEQAHEKYVI